MDARADRPGKTLRWGGAALELVNKSGSSGPADLPVVETIDTETLDADGGIGPSGILLNCGEVHTCESRAFVLVTDLRVDGGPAYLRFNIDVDYTFGELDDDDEAAPATLDVTVTLPLGPLDAGP